MSESRGELTNKPFAAQLSNVYFSILALFCFKLFVKISLNLLAYFYIVRGNRKEAARISAEFYDYGQQHSKYSDGGGDIQDRRLTEVMSLGFLLPFYIMSSQDSENVSSLCINHFKTCFLLCLSDDTVGIWAIVGCNVNTCR